MSVPADVSLVWLQRARSDLQLGRVALNTKGVMPEDAAFQGQQCAEKALKALLLHRGISFPKTHAIEVLLDLLKAQGSSLPSGVDEAFELSEYAVQTRYPGEWEPVTKTEARKAIERAGPGLGGKPDEITVVFRGHAVRFCHCEGASPKQSPRSRARSAKQEIASQRTLAMTSSS